MNTSKIIETINKFYTLKELDRDPTNEEKEFMCYFELELAKSILCDLNKESSKKLALILLSAIEDCSTSI